MTTSLISLGVATLATYRLTRLVVSDEITAPLREKVIDRFGHPEDSKVSYLVTCPHCVSVYAALGISAARMMGPSRSVDALVEALAMSAITGMLAEREDSF